MRGQPAHRFGGWIMYKKQMKLQRLLCIALIIVCALAFVYSLGIMTDLYDSLYEIGRAHV